MRLKLKCGNCGRNIQIEGEEIPRLSWMECPNCDAKFQTPSNILNVDDEIGGFKILRHLGSGAMGCVYLATQLSMERKVALKVLPPELTHNEEEIVEFIREVRLLAKLDHPSIVKALEAGKDDGSDNYFLAMNFVDGRSLEEEIEHEGPLTEKQALKIALKVADALSHAWKRHGILHRDIKPSNIMLRDATHPVLLDMGISKIHGTQTGRTTQGMMLGTPHYMSPEQARDSSNVDFRTDIYALGCTVFFMLTGKVPYDAPDVLGVVSKHAFEEIPSPKDHNPSVSGRCAKLLRRMMAKDPNERYDSWNAVAVDIKRVLTGNSTMARIPKEDRHVRQTIPLEGPVVPRKRRAANPLIWAGAFFLLLLSAIMVFALCHLGGQEEEKATDFGPPTVIMKKPRPKRRPARRKPSPTPKPVSNAKTLPDLGMDDFTVSMWFQRQTDHPSILACSAPGRKTGERFLSINNGKLAYETRGGSWLRTTKVLNRGEWYHVALTGATPTRLYINGRLAGQVRNRVIPLPAETSLRIGRMGGNSRAQIDSLRFYRYQMNAAEVKWDMEKGRTNKGLVGHFGLNVNGRDESGCGNHMIIHGRLSFVKGKIDNCVQLTSAGELVYGKPFGGRPKAPAHEGAKNTLPDFGKDPHTVTVWARPQLESGAIFTQCHPKKWTLHSKWFGIHDGKLCFYCKGAVKIQTKTPVGKQLNQWHHFAITNSGTKIRLYVNGKLEGYGSLRNASDPKDSIFRVTTRKGAAIDVLKGDIDSMRIYRVQLSDREIAADMASARPLPGKPMAAWWEFEGNGKDSSGQGNELASRGSFGFTKEGKHGAALRVKGEVDIMLKVDAARLR